MAEFTKLSYQQAELRTRCRLNRRRSYWLRDDGVVVVLERMPSEPCTGCHETSEGQCAHRCKSRGLTKCAGGGCHECGYQGRVTLRVYVPVLAKDRPAGGWAWDPDVIRRSEPEADDARP